MSANKGLYRVKIRPWSGVDYSCYCSKCGRQKKTTFPPGDFLQLCQTCYHDIEIRAEKCAELEEASNDGVVHPNTAGVDFDYWKNRRPEIKKKKTH